MSARLNLKDTVTDMYSKSKGRQANQNLCTPNYKK